MTARYRLAPHVGYVPDPSTSPAAGWLADLRTGPIMMLPVEAAIILECALQTVDDELTLRVSAVSGRPLAVVADATEQFVAQLLRDGYLQEQSVQSQSEQSQSVQTQPGHERSGQRSAAAPGEA
ncbi:hypothetical protein HJ588_12505 [Flexivirga sp. ID2601S]|uniref:Uncharacterized protein n=1 Tax=Flexivirga aerilata TaxID=1656889 RepID=A0A849AGW2_9MICO|nr:hypothetical protein [Flexivirga aerilata]NNG40084.1 hypothetical protein [Flexivirga aerilata]